MFSESAVSVAAVRLPPKTASPLVESDAAVTAPPVIEFVPADTGPEDSTPAAETVPEKEALVLLSEQIVAAVIVAVVAERAVDAIELALMPS
jgi:hypothetical protein